TPSQIEAGIVGFTLTASPINPCVLSANDQKSITILKNPTVTAGDDVTICEDQVITLAGTASDYSEVAWSPVEGLNDPAVLGPIFNPTPAQIEAGLVAFTLTASPNNPCVTSANDQVTITIYKNPTAAAGNDATMCEDQEISLNGTATEYSEVAWSPAEGLNDPAILSPVFIPTAAQVEAGMVEFTLTASPNNPCTLIANDVVSISIQKNPVAIAGDDAMICENDTYQLAGIVENETAFVWTTSGDGTFNQADILDPVYTPGTQDMLSGYAELTLSVEPIGPCTVTDISSMTLSIQWLPVAEAGNDAIICENQEIIFEGTATDFSEVAWTPVEGLSDPAILSPTFIPTPSQIEAGIVGFTLTASPINPCSVNAEDFVSISIQRNPVAMAGIDGSVSQGIAFGLTDATAEYSSSVLWSASGDGTFDANNIINPTYTLGENDVLAESVELCLLAEPVNPCNIGDNDCMILYILLDKQEVQIPMGWSGISSFVQPVYDNMETVTLPMVQNIRQMWNYSGIFQPEWGVNTIGNWNYMDGYVIKVTAESSLILSGSESDSKTINLTEGWNIIPVLDDVSVPSSDIFSPLGDILIIAKEIAGINIYYPAFNITSLNSVASGKAYFVKVTQDCSITYPANVSKAGIQNDLSIGSIATPWNEINVTAGSHTMVFPAAINGFFEAGDMIGAFDQDATCSGIIQVGEDGQSFALNLFSDDQFTGIKDGFADGETIQIKMFRPSTGETRELEISYDQSSPNQGQFTNHGISVIGQVDYKASSIGGSLMEGQMKVEVYPNPATTMVNVMVSSENPVDAEVLLLNANGQLVLTNNLKHISGTTTVKLDVMGLPKGIYYLKVAGNNLLKVEKVVIK
nr:T9SS type A sorting domain-containing protein [Bacteroidota bacterium]